MCSRRRSHRQAKLMPKRDLKSTTGKKQRNQRMQIKQSVCGVLFILSSPLKSTNSCRRTESGDAGEELELRGGPLVWRTLGGNKRNDTSFSSSGAGGLRGPSFLCVCCGTTEIRFVSSQIITEMVTRRKILERHKKPEKGSPKKSSFSGNFCHLVKKAFKKYGLRVFNF